MRYQIVYGNSQEKGSIRYTPIDVVETAADAKKLAVVANIVRDKSRYTHVNIYRDGELFRRLS